MFSSDRLAKRLIAAVILISTMFSLVTSGIQIYLRYSEDVKLLNSNFDYVETGFKASIEKSIWFFNFPQLEVVLDGVQQQPDIKYIHITTNTGQNFTRGEKSHDTLNRLFELHYKDGSEITPLGQLEIEVSKKSAKDRLWKNIWVIVITNSIKTFFVSFTLLFLFYFMVGRHLQKISKFLSEREGFINQDKLTLNRTKKNNDNLENIVDAINEMLSRVETSHKNLDKSIDKLSSKNEQLERFAYISSHDLREPLRNIMSYTGLIENNLKNKFDTKTERYFNFILNSGRRMQGLLDDLLSYTRVDHEADFTESIDMNQAVSSALKNLDSTIEKKHASIEYADLPTITGNQVLIVQLLQNLISNSLKYQLEDNKPNIKITAESEEKQWVFCVSDNGIGIDEKYHMKVFEAFRRLHARDKYEGSGIGLAICVKILENLGGKIWLESNEGEGASFYFSIPYMQEN